MPVHGLIQIAEPKELQDQKQYRAAEAYAEGRAVRLSPVQAVDKQQHEQGQHQVGAGAEIPDGLVQPVDIQSQEQRRQLAEVPQGGREGKGPEVEQAGSVQALQLRAEAERREEHPGDQDEHAHHQNGKIHGQDEPGQELSVVDEQELRFIGPGRFGHKDQPGGSRGPRSAVDRRDLDSQLLSRIVGAEGRRDPVIARRPADVAAALFPGGVLQLAVQPDLHIAVLQIDGEAQTSAHDRPVGHGEGIASGSLPVIPRIFLDAFGLHGKEGVGCAGIDPHTGPEVHEQDEKEAERGRNGKQPADVPPSGGRRRTVIHAQAPPGRGQDTEGGPSAP